MVAGQGKLLRVLFLSRAHPPVVGGIENQNYALSKWLPTVAHVTTIANRRSKRALAWFLPLVAIRALMLGRRYDVVLLGDGVLAAVGWIIKVFQPSMPVVCVVHGLDISYSGWIYRRLWVRRFLRHLDKIITVSRSTRALAQAMGVGAGRLECIANGVEVHTALPRYGRHDLEKVVGAPLDNGAVLVTIGRLVRRKGVQWFVENVVPLLPRDTWYLIAGTGPEQAALQRALAKLRPGHRVRLLGMVEEGEKSVLLGAADLFIQPNIRVEGDPEGFGISVLEAGDHALPVIASALEGLTDALTDGENGWLVEPENARAYAEEIRKRLANLEILRTFGDRARCYVHSRFAWDVVIVQYRKVLEKAIGAAAENSDGEECGGHDKCL